MRISTETLESNRSELRPEGVHSRQSPRLADETTKIAPEAELTIGPGRGRVQPNQRSVKRDLVPVANKIQEREESTSPSSHSPESPGAPRRAVVFGWKERMNFLRPICVHRMPSDLASAKAC